MGSKNTRIDVEVNTGNAKSQLRELANDVNRVNNQVNSAGGSSTSGGASNQDKQSAASLLRQQSADREKQIRKEYENLRKSNFNEFDEFSQRHKQGKVSDTEFEDYRKGFHESQVGSFAEERDDINENTRRTNELLEELIGRQDEANNQADAAAQNSNAEFGGGGGQGILQKLFGERSSLMQQRMEATSEEELSDINKRLSKVNKQISKKSGGAGIADMLTEAGQGAGSIMEGGGQGMMSTGMSLLSKAGPYGMAAAAIAAAVGGAISLGNTRDKSTANLTSYRALGDREAINANIKNTDYTSYGIENAEEWTQKRKEMLMGSGRYQSASTTNTLNAIKMEKGYGIENVAQLSSMERQDRYAKTTSENIVEMLNVLGAIKDGSISKDDFTLANEKAGLMNRLEAGQVSRQEKFDSKQVLGLMTAFEKMGGEGKDQRAGDFIEGTLGAMREGGSANIMMLKHKFAMDAHPELANDPAALSRMIEEGNDPAYISASLKGLKNTAGGNKQNQYFLFKEYFKNLTPSMRAKLIDAGGDSEILGNIKGVGLGDSGIASMQNAGTYAKSKVQGTDELLNDISKSISNAGDWFKDFFRDPVDVNIRNADKTSNKGNAPKNEK